MSGGGERGNGVTILYAGQVFLTQPPVNADRLLVAHVIKESREFEKAGRPLSQQTPRP